jgi:hypothetical protein
VSLLGAGTAGSTTHENGGPLDKPVRVPWLDHPAHVGAWVVALVELSGGLPPQYRSIAARVALHTQKQGMDVHVEWPDGVRSQSRLDLHPWS